VDEAFSFLEQNRVTIRPERDDFSDSVAEFMQRNRLKINLQAAQPYFLFLSSVYYYFYLKILVREGDSASPGQLKNDVKTFLRLHS
jgi:hypothetical protein